MTREGTWEPEQRAAILRAAAEWVADGGTLAGFCRQEGMPSRQALNTWRLDDPDPLTALRFARAREIGSDSGLDDAQEIADTQVVAEIVTVTEDKDGTTTQVRKQDALEHRKLRVWTRLQIRDRCKPQNIGEATGSGEDLLQDLAEAKRRGGDRAP